MGPPNVTDLPFIAWVDFSTDADPISYALDTHHTQLLVAHMACMVLATVIILPAALVLKHHRYRPFLWLATCATCVVGLSMGASHRRQTSDMYPNAVHRKSGLVLVVVIFVYALCAWTQSWRSNNQGRVVARFRPLQASEWDASEVYDQRQRQDDESLTRPASENSQMTVNDDAVDAATILSPKASRPRTMMRRVRSVCSPITTVIVLVLTYSQILLGIATYCALFKDHEIFNGLAHWCKASAFLFYGIWVFMRYLGFASHIGHSWNHGSSGTSSVTPERIECGLLFTYGIIDIFLERLGHSDEPISHTDIQHMCIAAIFAFAGLIGLLLESRTLQRLLSESGSAPDSAGRATFNVMPALVIFFTGLFMSQHSQDSQFTTDLHTTWGYYFCTAAILRVCTYCLVFLSPRSFRASQPPTEPLVSFTMIAGAIVFMMSARDPAQALEYYGIGLMFCISISVAGALAIMTWTMYILVLQAVDRTRFTSQLHTN